LILMMKGIYRGCSDIPLLERADTQVCPYMCARHVRELGGESPLQRR